MTIAGVEQPTLLDPHLGVPPVTLLEICYVDIQGAMPFHDRAEVTVVDTNYVRAVEGRVVQPVVLVEALRNLPVLASLDEELTVLFGG